MWSDILDRSSPRTKKDRKLPLGPSNSKLGETAREQHRAGGARERERERERLMDIAPTLHGEYEIEVLWNWMGKKVGEF
jgi:hypothetical protein